jgi:hypothetical protein
MQKKALYVRFKGIPEGVIFLLAKSAENLINKGLSVMVRNEVSLPPHFHKGRLCKSGESNLSSQVGQESCLSIL